jgi:cyanophycin synthetase
MEATATTPPTLTTYKEALSYSKNTQLACYILSAIKLGISFKMIIPGSFAEFWKGEKRWRIHKALTPINNSVAMSLATYKSVCNRFLREQGFPVPEQQLVTSPEDIGTFKKEHSLEEIVVKPTRGFGGGGVSILPHTDDEIKRAFTFAYEKALTDNPTRVIVEEFILGRHFRIMVLDDKVIAASERMAPFVTGDGTSTIRKLVDTQNCEYKEIGRPQINIEDEEARKALLLKKYTQDSVPTNGEHVIVRLNANMTSGGTVRECLIDVHDMYKKLAVDITKAIGLTLAGIDLITPDISRPAEKYAVNEVNHNPGVRIHYMPDQGEITDVCTTIQQYILTNF